MPVVRKLMPEEIQILRRRGARVDLTLYSQALADLEIGDWGIIELEPNEKVPTIKRRYQMAARQQKKSLAYKRLRKGTIPFTVQPMSDEEPVRRPRPASSNGRRGRPPGKRAS